MNKRRGLCVGLSLLMVCCLWGCGGKNADSGEQKNPKPSRATTISEDYFEWDGNTIKALTEEGKKQETLVIPERCEGFDTKCYLGGDDCKVKHVSFESDKDVELNHAFYAARGIVSIELPEQLSKIDDSAFYFCSSLEELIIPPNVQSVGAHAADGATSLKKVIFRGNTVVINRQAFEGCYSLETVELCDSITEIGQYAFHYCSSLKQLTLPASLKKVGGYVCLSSGVTDVTVPQELVFEDCDLTAFLTNENDVTVHITKGSWIDQHYDDFFRSLAFVKQYD